MLLQGTAGLALAATIFSNSLSFLPPQFATVDDVPKAFFANQRTIYGKVVRVIDGDTIRIRHCPTRWQCPALPDTRRIYDSTLSIRLYGVDAPELQKRKTDPISQPFAEEAKTLTEKLVLNKKVQVKLLRKDQYGRAVAKVLTARRVFPPLSRLDMSMELTQRGLATIYTGGGAEYDGNLEILRTKQAVAERKGRGIWSQGDNVVTPADFKRQQRQMQATGATI